MTAPQAAAPDLTGEPGLPLEVAGPDGARLAAIEAWCAAMRAAGAGDTAFVEVEIVPSGERRNCGVALLLRGFPHTSTGPVRVGDGAVVFGVPRNEIETDTADLPAPGPARPARRRWRWLHPVGEDAAS